MHAVDDDKARNMLHQLVDKFVLNEKQQEQFVRYAHLLIEWNKKFNITAIDDSAGIIQFHFFDSLYIADFIDFTTVHNTVDVGTGGGFPGLALKIAFPHLTMVLIEVNTKKISFLEYVIQELGLTNVIIYSHDWRTFIRTTSYTIDYFFARASLQPEELIRIFKPSSPYQNAIMIYWASQQWVAQGQVQQYVEKEIEYTVGNVNRKYIFLRKS